MTDNKQESGAKHGEMDESLYSRQLYVLGVDAMKRMQQVTLFTFF
jgi:molybdopterin/thiamine biosynthesis adenylyltransferase